MTCHKIFLCFHRIGHILVFVAIALYIGLTVRRGRNYISLIGIIILILLGTLGEKNSSFFFFLSLKNF